MLMKPPKDYALKGYAMTLFVNYLIHFRFKSDLLLLHWYRY